MKRNGFTLIELLAVIVILAIIALIATPIVLNIINNAKTSSNERSGELYVKSVENAIMKKQMNGTDVVEDGEYTVQSDGSICIVSNNVCSDGTTITIDVEGDVPEAGTLTVSNGVVVSYNLVVSGTSIVKVDSSSDEEDDDGENQENNTYIGKYYKGVNYNPEASFKFIDTNNIIYYEKNDNVWYYNELTVEEYFGIGFIDKNNSDLISYCNQYSIDLSTIGSTIIELDSANYMYFNDDYTKIYHFCDGEEIEVDCELISNTTLINELENATLDEDLGKLKS